MKIYKRLVVVLLTFVLVFCFKNTIMAYNGEDRYQKKIELLRWDNEVVVTPSLVKEGSYLKVLAHIYSSENTTQIKTTLKLEEKTSSGWISLAGWVTTEYSSSLSASYTYPRASSGKTYRLTVTEDVTTNGRTETVSRSVTESF